MGEKGTRQGREKELGRERGLAVGRIGKGPAHVPAALVEAMRRVREYRLFARRKLSTVHEDQDDGIDEEEVQRSEEVAMAMLKDSRFVSEGLQDLPKPFLTLVSTHLWGPSEGPCWSPSEKRYLPYMTYEEGGFEGWHYKEGEVGHSPCKVSSREISLLIGFIEIRGASPQRGLVSGEEAR